MRAMWIAAGVGVSAGFAMAQPVHRDIDVVLQGGGSELEIYQVAVQDDGFVAARVSVDWDDAVTLYTGGSNVAGDQVIAARDQTAWGTSAIDDVVFIGFGELAISGSGSDTRLTFVGDLGGTGAVDNRAGIFQYREAGSTQNPVYSDATDPSLRVNVWDGPFLQVNASGTALFPMEQPNEIWRKAVGGAEEVVASAALDVYEYGQQASVRHAITPDGSAVYLAKDNSGDTTLSIMKFGVGATEPTLVAGGVAGYEPTLLMGATDNHVLYHAYNGDTNKTAAFIVQDGEQVLLHEYDGLGGANFYGGGMLSANDKGAFVEIDGTFTSSLWYFDAAETITGPLDSPIVIGDGSSEVDGWTISSLDFDLFNLSAPMVNDNGFVVFSALLENDEESGVQAFLSWSEATGLGIIAKAGDTFDLEGETKTIFTLVSTGLSADADPLKDGLSDVSNYFAFGVIYGEDDYENFAILRTQLIPEPGTAALLAGGMLSLAMRRRRPA